ncbi:MAG: DUF1624 domain-containing protein, partial [Bacteroidia bacterium]|nr:DUF1624 domain-containing protein [Bacteroidia bacterium]
MTVRSQAVDLLKGIAVVLMINVHIIELFASNSINNVLSGKIFLFLGGPPVAPLFALIFGYYISASKKTLTQLITRGAKIFCLGMLLNIALNLNLLLSANKGLLKVDVLHYIFGVDILQFAGISIILLALVKKILEKNILVTFSLAALSAFLGAFLLNYIPANTTLKYLSSFFYGSTAWSYFPLFPWIAYPLVGMAFYQLTQRFDLSKLNKISYKLLMVLSLILFLAFTIRYAVSISSDLQLYYHHGIIFALWTFLFLAFYCFFVNETDKLIGKTVL